jgi:hypothetical protein
MLPNCPGCGVLVDESNIIIPWERTRKVARVVKRAGKWTGKWTSSPAWGPPYLVLYLFLYSIVMRKGGGSILAWNVRRKANKRMRRLEKQRAIDDRVREANEIRLKQEEARKEMLSKGMASIPERDFDADRGTPGTRRRAYPTPAATKDMQNMHVCQFCGAIWPSVETQRKCEGRHTQYKTYEGLQISHKPERLLGGEVSFGVKDNKHRIGMVAGVTGAGLVVSVNWDSDRYSSILDRGYLKAGGFGTGTHNIEVPYEDIRHVRVRRPNYLLREGTCSPQHLVDKDCMVLRKSAWVSGIVGLVNTNKSQRPILGVGSTRIPCLRRPDIELVVDTDYGEIKVSDPNTIYIME